MFLLQRQKIIQITHSNTYYLFCQCVPQSDGFCGLNIHVSFQFHLATLLVVGETLYLKVLKICLSENVHNFASRNIELYAAVNKKASELLSLCSPLP